MAVDKLVDSTQLDADLTSVANAIRTKGGTSGQLSFPAGFVNAVDAITTGANIEDTFDDWQRPSDWPDLDAICPDDFAGALITYQVRDPVYYPYNKIKLFLNGTAPRKVELGTVQGGAFVPFETHDNVGNTFEEDLPTDHGEFIVVRVTMAYVKSIYFAQIDQAPKLQPAVEIYACGFREVGTATNTFWHTFNTQHYVLRDSMPTSLYGFFGNAYSLKKIEFVNCNFELVSDNRTMMSGALNLQSAELNISLPNISTFAMPNPQNVRKLLLHNMILPSNSSCSLTNIFGSRAVLQVLTLPSVAITDMYNAFYNDTSLMYLDLSRLDLSATSRLTGAFNGCVSLITVLLPTVYLSLSFYQSPLLSDESLVGIANALSASVTGQTVTLHADSKAKCLTIMGNNVDGVFVADATGNMSVTDFITNVKGWTVA